MTDIREIRHFHLFCGLGGGAAGFNKASPRVGNMQGKFRCIGGVDVDPAAIRDFAKISGVPGTVLDMFDRDQYRAFHGVEPPSSWLEATPADIRNAAGNERPHIVFLSAPCKGFSGLLSEGKSKTDKYQALNRLTLRGVWLMLEAWADDPPELIIFENVPRIATRGRHLLDQITGMLRHYGYAVAETTHDCGEIGGLAQSRKRFLLVGRHVEKVPPFLYEPEKKPLQAVGSVLGRMPMPGDQRGGLMHRIPSLQWKTWVRLAFVEAGSDWRSLNKLAVQDGYLRDFLIVPEKQSFANGYMGVVDWNGPSGAVRSKSLPLNGNFSVADPRPPAGSLEYAQYGVIDFADSMGAIIGVKSPGQGTFAVADPRHTGPAKHSNEYRIVPFDHAAQAVTSAHGSGQAVADPRGGEDPDKLHGKYHVNPWETESHAVIAGNANGAYAVADPRAPDRENYNIRKYKVNGFEDSTTAVIGASTAGDGAFAVADPRPTNQRNKGDHYLTNGHYGVVSFDEPAGAVSAAASHDNGNWSVADPRMPMPNDKVIAIIRALDNTWHRPFTTLELAALQSLIDPEDYIELDGLSDQAWRERIGNAVPRDAAESIGNVFGTTLLLAWSGETFILSSQPIWVRPFAIALNLGQTA
jgi:site-specific DNA-cytosine methylase